MIGCLSTELVGKAPLIEWVAGLMGEGLSIYCTKYYGITQSQACRVG